MYWKWGAPTMLDMEVGGAPGPPITGAWPGAEGPPMWGPLVGIIPW